MGAIFFYIFIYFIGYYASNVLNMVTVRPLVTNRYMAALVPVYGFAFGHAYMVVTKPLPAGADISMEYALLVFITLPVVVVTMGAAYFMWNSKGKDDHADGGRESAGATTAEATVPETAEQKAEVHLHLHSHTHSHSNFINIATETSKQKTEDQDEILAPTDKPAVADTDKSKDGKNV